MLRVGFARIWPDKESRLRAWLAELGSRREEVIESFQRETVRQEQVFIVAGDTGPVLVYAIDAQDLGQATAAYKESTLPIDKEHRAVLQDCLQERLNMEPLFDCAINSERTTDAA